MTGPEAKRLVVVSTVGTAVLTTVAVYRRQRNAPPLRVAAGAVVVGVILATLAEPAPQVAAGLAVLMLTTAAFVLGGDAWAGISAITAPEGN